MFSFLGQLGSFIMTPLYYLTSVRAARPSTRLFGGDLRPGDRPRLGALDHRPDPGDPGRADPAVRQADQVQPEHAAAAAQGQGAAEEVRPRPGAARRRRRWRSTRRPGTNPFASCLPMILQMPIFLALFRLIDHAAKHPDKPRGLMTAELAHQFANATFLGAKISDSFTSHRRRPSVQDPGRRPGGGDDRHHVHDPAPADEQEHAGRRDDRAVRPAAEDAALRAPAWSSRSAASPSRSACSSTGPPRTCGRWASSST